MESLRVLQMEVNICNVSISASVLVVQCTWQEVLQAIRNYSLQFLPFHELLLLFLLVVTIK